MSAVTDARQPSARELEPILAVAAKLAAPFDLTTMLGEVADAAKHVLKAERCTVWLYDAEADELVLRIAADIHDKRIPSDTGLVGACARSRRAINVPDCYADPRFDPTMDRVSGFHTRCMLTLPLIDHGNLLVGVMQVLNKAEGIFDSVDEHLATVLAAQCAVALQRVRMTEALIDSEKMRRELEMARVVQMSSLPSSMPVATGYDLFGTTRPADLTGGDTFDLTQVGERVLVVLADATGHGIGPALSVTQMQAMLRMAFRLGADLEYAFVEANNLLGLAMPADRFITAFIGLLDPSRNVVRYHSGGQAPIFLYRAATREFERHGPTSFPLAAMPLESMDPAAVAEMHPGDILVLVSDGIFEYCDDRGEQFGEARACEVIAAHADGPMAQLSEHLFAAVKAFAGHAPQEDDMTVVLVKRSASGEGASFARRVEALDDIFAFTAATFSRQGIDSALRGNIDFVLEELFTNVVKYGRPSASEVRIEVMGIPGGVEVTLIEDDAHRFDPTAAPDVDVTMKIDLRTPGGLGLHLIRRLVDSVEYLYNDESHQGRITFRKTMAATKGSD